jgi:hypothetical protein
MWGNIRAGALVLAAIGFVGWGIASNEGQNTVPPMLLLAIGALVFVLTGPRARSEFRGQHMADSKAIRERIADIEREQDALAQSFDGGEITALEFTRRHRQLERELFEQLLEQRLPL